MATNMRSDVKDLLLRVRWWIFHLNRRQIRRWLYKVTRPGSSPYISGDSFRRLARHIYDETNQRFRPRTVRPGDVIFVSTDYAHRFFHEIEQGIPCKYRLITHNSDVPVDSALVKLASERTESWFALNNTFADERITPIPIGLENAHHCSAGVTRDFDEVRSRVGSKLPRILSGFTIATNPGERQRVYELAVRSPSVDQLPARMTQREYLEKLASYEFLLCPPGNGLDTHRTWEAMYLQVIPIVSDSIPARAFERQGLPLWIIPRWEDLLTLSEKDLEGKYRLMRERFSAPGLWMDYWRKLIAAPRSIGTRREAVGVVDNSGVRQEEVM